MKKTSLSLIIASAICANNALAADVEIGSVEKNGMEITAVYIQPVKMKPMMPGMGHEADMHLEADIAATANNLHGFADGDWVPYLGITYVITKKDSTWSTQGSLHPMIAADGPHYAANVKLDGVGKYQLRYHINPPAYQGFYHHTDKETGTPEWWTPFDAAWNFTFLGVGKKGGY